MFLVLVSGVEPRLDKSTLRLLESGQENADVRARLTSVWNCARDVWGETDNAMDFLFHSHPMINDQRPIDITLESEDGATAVHNILGRLRFGSAA
jgi:putative toxin-antitoxin system antitoxin component (TIGR02293 family)